MIEKKDGGEDPVEGLSIPAMTVLTQWGTARAARKYGKQDSSPKFNDLDGN